MADYCTLKDVTDLVGGLVLDAGTQPTAVQATALLVHITAELDALLRAHGYVLPIAEADLPYLHTLATYGSAALILKAKYGTDGSGGDKGRAALFQKRYDEGKALFDSGSSPLSAAPAASSVGEGFSRHHGRRRHRDVRMDQEW